MIQRSFWLVYLVLITLAAALGADMTVSYLQNRLSEPIAIEERPRDRAPQGVVRRPPSDYDVIAARNIFNANPRPAEPPKTESVIEKPKLPDRPVEDTTLRLKLAGTVIGDDNQFYAVIEDSTNRGHQGVYQVGDAIQNRIIAEIQDQCVILDLNGKYERLCFESYQGSGAVSPGRRAGATSAEPETEAISNSDEDVVQVDNATWQIRRELMQEQFANLGGLSQQARVTPYIVQGETRGFRLTRLKANSLLQKIGLQHGDVLQKVNGSSITSPADALQAYQQLQQAGTVRLEILRRNRASTLTYEIR